MVDVEVFGARLAPDAPTEEQIQWLCTLAATRRGVGEGHVAIEFVDAQRIAQLNGEHRDKSTPTDVLSFPIDGVEEVDGTPRELGDVVICPEYTTDLAEAIVHGMLHLLGMDHERDDGEMLALQRELLAGAGR
jgi:probable rRNA maturation factor